MTAFLWPFFYLKKEIRCFWLDVFVPLDTVIVFPRSTDN